MGDTIWPFLINTASPRIGWMSFKIDGDVVDVLTRMFLKTHWAQFVYHSAVITTLRVHLVSCDSLPNLTSPLGTLNWISG